MQGPTYQICSLIFFPLSSTVLILKSTPVNKTDKDEAKTRQSVRKAVLAVCRCRKNQKPDHTEFQKEREEIRWSPSRVHSASLHNALVYVRFHPELEMKHLLFVILLEVQLKIHLKITMNHYRNKQRLYTHAILGGEILNVEHWKLNLDFKQPQSELRNYCHKFFSIHKSDFIISPIVWKRNSFWKILLIQINFILKITLIVASKP